MKPGPKLSKTLLALGAMIFWWVHAGTAIAYEGATISHNGRDYVSAKNIKEFYGFTSFSVASNTLYFRSPGREMRAPSGNVYLYINKVKFHLSHSIIRRGSDYLFSRLDVDKLIDPVLRPTRIDIPRAVTTVVIDPGHGGQDTGSKSIYGHEKEFNLRLAFILKKELERRGFRVRMTRNDDSFPTLGGRVVFANRVPDSIFISLHFNWFRTREPAGIETYALIPKGRETPDGRSLVGNARDAENIALATAVHAAMLKKTRADDRGIKRDSFTVLADINKPSILIEGGFLSNPKDARNIASTSYLSLMAAGIADACVTYRNAMRR